jgi:hypothetical protein
VTVRPVSPAPSPSESGRGTRWSPSTALRLAWPQTPCLEARVTPADRWARAQVVLPQSNGSRSQTRWSLHLSLLWLRHVTVPEPFSYPARRFLHAEDRRRLHSLHRRGTRLISGHCPRGWTSDLFSQLRPELGGSPVETVLSYLLLCLLPQTQIRPSVTLKGLLHYIFRIPFRVYIDT